MVRSQAAGRTADAETPLLLSDEILFHPAGERRDVVHEPSGDQLVIELTPDFVQASCRLPEPITWRHESRLQAPKVSRMAAGLLDAVRDVRTERAPVSTVLWAATARAVARRFGAPSGRTGDAWLAPQALRRVVEHVENHPCGDLTLAQLSRISGLGPSALLRSFRGTTGETPGAYVLRRRLVTAAALLRDTDMPVSTVAAETGFGSTGHLSTAFRTWCGVSPRRFRLERRCGRSVSALQGAEVIWKFQTERALLGGRDPPAL